MSRGKTRLLYDKGVRWTMVGLAAVLFILVLDRARQHNARTSPDARDVQTVQGQVFCRERTAEGAVVTLRPALSVPPERAGKVLDAEVTPKNGEFTVELPYPTPPDFNGELQVAAEGCFTHRQGVRSREKTLLIRGITLETRAPPLDVADPPPAPNFPPAATDEQTRLVREMGAASPHGFALFDGPAPTCAQCHDSVVKEHRKSHGRAPSPSLRALAQAAGEAANSCAGCHAPVAALRAPDLRAPISDEAAFSCSACHRFMANDVVTGNGLANNGAFVLPPPDTRRVALGTRADSASPAMAVGYWPRMHQSTQCASCHAWSRGSVVLDPTTTEHLAWQRSTPDNATRSCQDCHMPRTDDAYLVDGHARALWGVARTEAPRRSHAGPVDGDAALRESVTWKVGWEGNDLVVEAVNHGAGHALPGVAPLRAWRVEIVGAGVPTSGPVLAEGKPGVELRRVFDGGTAGGCALPWEADRVLDDNRLLPGVAARWMWKMPARAAVQVRVSEVDACASRAAQLGVTREARVLWELTP
ncbi:MAG: hypothetical protein AB2A00_13250 [Myxococcota bacterium]